MYHDGKKHAIPSLHRDSFVAKEHRTWPVLASGNTTSPYCRAVSCKLLHMRNISYCLLVALLFASCKENKFDTIDFIAYSYLETDSKNPLYDREWRLICPFYLHIDNKFNCQCIRGNTFSDSNTYFFQSKNDPNLKKIINEILTKSNSLGTHTDFRSPQPAIYDGSDLTIQITKKGKGKIIQFWQDNDETKVYEKLLYYSISLYKSNPHLPSDSIALRNRNYFIEFVIKYDSLYRPLPPSPPKDFKPDYIPPIVEK